MIPFRYLKWFTKFFINYAICTCRTSPKDDIDPFFAVNNLNSILRD